MFIGHMHFVNFIFMSLYHVLRLPYLKIHFLNDWGWTRLKPETPSWPPKRVQVPKDLDHLLLFSQRHLQGAILKKGATWTWPDSPTWNAGIAGSSPRTVYCNLLSVIMGWGMPSLVTYRRLFPIFDGNSSKSPSPHGFSELRLFPCMSDPQLLMTTKQSF